MRKPLILFVLIFGLLGITLPALAGDLDRSPDRSSFTRDATLTREREVERPQAVLPTLDRERPQATNNDTVVRPDFDLKAVIDLSGEAEVPAGSGDPDGNGKALVLIDVDAGKVCYFIRVSNIDAVVAGHIHSGGVDVDGPVVVDLMPLEAATRTDEIGVRFRQCLTDVDEEVLAAIVADPDGYYVNIHTAAFPDGAIRGQLA